ncbi:MAG: putative O-glycosylation ligase, exosortase A system-associated [Gallionella sp.]|nr:putative O-glycosylation ligase, exosortase A system-associated [Gallionella sp.]
MRDLLLAAFVFGSIPFILKRPYWGLLMWVWLSLMNPHRLAWGFAYSMPFAMVIAVVTFASILVHLKNLYTFPVNGITLCLISMVLWVCVSPPFSFHSDGELSLWLRVIKIQVMVLIAFFLVGNRDELHKLTWVLALSVGFYGIKGGLFTIATRGSYKVWGPDSSFISDNNTVALAIIMSVPLFRYLQLHSENLWIRRGCLAAMVLCTASAVGSYSRGALLALLAMAGFLWLKSRNKAMTAIFILATLPAIVAMMPESWTGRMNTIENFSIDSSALGRINAWWMAWNLASDRFPIGGGFNIYTSDLFARYAPDPMDVHAAHSIYFQMLGEHGFIGLFLFLSVFGLAWLSGRWVIKNTRSRKDMAWAHDLASMSQVSLVGYAVGGAFLSLTYYDFPYYIVVMLVVLREIVRKELATEAFQNSRVESVASAIRLQKAASK